MDDDWTKPEAQRSGRIELEPAGRYRVWRNGTYIGEVGDPGAIPLWSDPVNQGDVLQPDVTWIHAKRLPVGWWVYEEGAWWRTGGWRPTWKSAKRRLDKLK